VAGNLGLCRFLDLGDEFFQLILVLNLTHAHIFEKQFLLSQVGTKLPLLRGAEKRRPEEAIKSDVSEEVTGKDCLPCTGE
jgi:hypothetical protein